MSSNPTRGHAPTDDVRSVLSSQQDMTSTTINGSHHHSNSIDDLDDAAATELLRRSLSDLLSLLSLLAGARVRRAADSVSAAAEMLARAIISPLRYLEGHLTESGRRRSAIQRVGRKIFGAGPRRKRRGARGGGRGHGMLAAAAAEGGDAGTDAGSAAGLVVGGFLDSFAHTAPAAPPASIDHTGLGHGAQHQLGGAHPDAGPAPVDTQALFSQLSQLKADIELLQSGAAGTATAQTPGGARGASSRSARRRSRRSRVSRRISGLVPEATANAALAGAAAGNHGSGATAAAASAAPPPPPPPMPPAPQSSSGTQQQQQQQQQQQSRAPIPNATPRIAGAAALAAAARLNHVNLSDTASEPHAPSTCTPPRRGAIAASNLGAGDDAAPAPAGRNALLSEITRGDAKKRLRRASIRSPGLTPIQREDDTLRGSPSTPGDLITLALRRKFRNAKRDSGEGAPARTGGVLSEGKRQPRSSIATGGKSAHGGRVSFHPDIGKENAAVDTDTDDSSVWE